MLDALRALSPAPKQSLMALDCGEAVPPSFQGYRPGGPLQALEQRLPWSPASKAAKVCVLICPCGGGGGSHTQMTQVMSTVQELYGRANSGDLLYVFLVLVNAYVKPIPQV